MTGILFMGVNITPDSEERDELPGRWWPHASLTLASTGAALEDVVHYENYRSKEEADAVALHLARRRIRDELHQG
ncbi:hypothetical protein SAMN04489707_1005115 [Paenacidovorax caeni]|uniref:Uncharacterized protein n=1 Tax=Paenacidovorax caeni TaxID=343013 RepID=A0A1I7GHG9_9BURK|nr:hypothetical protein [Paenacidovorax caeni]SFU47858.1 hypothetical protein SAMN04489707_1005115 [Paenacidovorax caeni]